MLSAGVESKEINASIVVGGNSGSLAGFAGEFKRGYAGVVTPISNPNDLVTYLGKPKNFNDWYQVRNFLDYAGLIYISRAISKGTFKVNGIVESADNTAQTITVSNSTIKVGDYIKFDITDTEDYLVTEQVADNVFKVLYTGDFSTLVNKDIFVKHFAVNALADIDKTAEEVYKDRLVIANEDDYSIMKDSIPADNFKVFYRYVGADGNGLRIAIANEQDFIDDKEVINGVKLNALFDSVPRASNKEIALIVIDGNEIPEKYIVSLDKNAKNYNGKSTFIDNVIFKKSTYIYTATRSETLVSKLGVDTLTLANGDDGILTQGDIEAAYGNVDENSLLADKDLGVSVIIANEQARVKAGNLAEESGKKIAIIAPRFEDCVGLDSNKIVKNLVSDVTNGEISQIRNSYSAYFGNYKLQYDPYTDTNIWVSVAGDIAGLRCRTDVDFATWYASAGVERGLIKNAIKLAFYPSKSQMDILYKNNINPITKINGYGNAIVWGQKTLAGVHSAFDRINVRGLFNTLKTDIEKMALANVFEFNDEFTRTYITSVLTSYLESIKAGRGVYDYKVVCDETNNTPQAIDNNELHILVAVKPTRTAEFITIKFVAVATSVSFDEVV